MRLTNTELTNFIDKIKLDPANMPKYRTQVYNLIEKLEAKIKNDTRTGLKVTRSQITGSWAKRTILRHTGENPIDVDLVLYVAGDEDLKNDLKKIHEFIVEYLEEIYPSMDDSQIDADLNSKSIKLIFAASGLEMDIVPVIEISNPKEFVLQPQRGGGGKRYMTSISKQLEFAKICKEKNQNYNSIVRAIKWWRNYKELKPTADDGGLSSFVIELIVSHLDINEKVETEIEVGIIRFFRFLSDPNFPIITFSKAINSIPASFDSSIYVADPTNNDNNTSKKVDDLIWKEIIKEANDAFDSLHIAQAKINLGDTIDEWKHVFGPSFNINKD